MSEVVTNRPTPAELGRLTTWSEADWSEAYNTLSRRDDWPKLVEVAVDKAWHPSFLVYVSVALEQVNGMLETFGLLRARVPDRYLFPRRRAAHAAYHRRSIARKRRSR